MSTEKAAGDSGEQPRPFDIRDYTLMLQEFTVTTRELNTLAGQLDTALPAVRATTQEATTAIKQIVDRLFLRLLLLVVITIMGATLAALAYRLLVARIPRH